MKVSEFRAAVIAALGRLTPTEVGARGVYYARNDADAIRARIAAANGVPVGRASPIGEAYSIEPVCYLMEDGAVRVSGNGGYFVATEEM